MSEDREMNQKELREIRTDLKAVQTGIERVREFLGTTNDLANILLERVDRMIGTPSKQEPAVEPEPEPEEPRKSEGQTYSYE